MKQPNLTHVNTHITHPKFFQNKNIPERPAKPSFQKLHLYPSYTARYCKHSLRQHLLFSRRGELLLVFVASHRQAFGLDFRLPLRRGDGPSLGSEAAPRQGWTGL